MSDFEKFKEELSGKEKFSNSSTNRTITDKEYEHVHENIWNEFEIKAMKDYLDLYVKYDVLLLTYLFEKFRNNRLKNFRLCPSHHLGAPGLSLDAMLKMIKFNIKLIPDLDVFIFFEKGKKGRISYIFKRHSKANNKYLKSYDPKQELKHIMYLDTNNLFAYAMYKFLPTSGFKWGCL